MSLETRIVELAQAIGADIKSLFTGKADTTHTHSAATTSVAGFMSSADKTKLDGVATGANNYSHPTGDGNLHVPATGTTNNGKVLTAGATAGSLSWTTIPAAPVSSVAGKTGAVTLVKGDVGLGNVDNTSDANKPVSTATQTALDAKQATITGAATTVATSNLTASMAMVTDAGGKIAAHGTVSSTELGYLGGVTSAIQTQLNGKASSTHSHAISDVTNLQTTLDGKASTSVATTSVNGLMSAADKTKLDGVATGANNYAHPTGDGNLHVPATGTTNSGRVLTAGATAGSVSWAALPEASASASGVVTTGAQTFAGGKTFSSAVTSTTGQFNSTASYAYLTVNGSNAFAANIAEAVVTSTFRTATDNAGSLGSSSNRWSAIYAVTGTISTSDARQKTQIEDTPLGLAFVQKLRPVKYKWKVAENIIDTEKSSIDSVVYSGSRSGVRDHYGLIAQEVEAALDGRDFAGLVIDEMGNYGLRYEQFISVLIKAVQELSAKVKKMEESDGEQ